MGRPKALDRKQQLLEEILEYLRTRTLASVTFRTLADALGVSSYVLVYQFGNREALLGDIVREVDYRIMFQDLPDTVDQDFVTFEKYTVKTMAGLMSAENRHLLRLQLEAALMDVVAENPQKALAQYLEMWAEYMRAYLRAVGIEEERARVLGDTLNAELTGIRVHYILTGDEDRALANVKLAVDQFRREILRAVGEPEDSTDGVLAKKITLELKAQTVAVKNRPNPAR